MEKNKDNEIYVEDYYPELENQKLTLEQQALLASKVSQYRDFYENDEYQSYDSLFNDIEKGNPIRGRR